MKTTTSGNNENKMKNENTETHGKQHEHNQQMKDGKTIQTWKNNK